MCSFALVVCLALLALPSPAQEQKGEAARPVFRPGAGAPAQRIWADTMQETQELWFRRRFKVPKGVRGARIAVSCDNECEVFLDGKRVGASDDWQKLTVIDIAALRAGDNVIAVHGKNTGSCAALVLWLTFTDATGKEHVVATNKSWRVSGEAAVDFAALSFDDKKWPAAKELGETAFAQNVYGYPPTGFDFVNEFSAAAGAIEKRLDAFRRARDRDAALQALADLEQAVMAARRRVWAQPPAGKGKPAPGKPATGK